MAQTIATFDTSVEPNLRHGLFVLPGVDFVVDLSSARLNKLPELCCCTAISTFSYPNANSFNVSPAKIQWSVKITKFEKWIQAKDGLPNSNLTVRWLHSKYNCFLMSVRFSLSQTSLGVNQPSNSCHCENAPPFGPTEFGMLSSNFLHTNCKENLVMAPHTNSIVGLISP